MFLALTLAGVTAERDRYMRWLALYGLLVLPLPYYVTHVCPWCRVPVLLLEAYWGGVGLQFLVQLMKERMPLRTVQEEE